MHLRSSALAALAIMAVSSCAEDERACYERLSADFLGSMEFANQQAASAPPLSDEAMSWRKYALRASESNLAITVIYSDDDRNACDYVSAGADLQRK